ncbi:hypothetical protein, partial [Sinorhizobium fredii]|uniref:hypothetical protein n=1 Tax=Rhizobium fredii TaxID=380 RepID=UPI001AEBD94E
MTERRFIAAARHDFAEKLASGELATRQKQQELLDACTEEPKTQKSPLIGRGWRLGLFGCGGL